MSSQIASPAVRKLLNDLGFGTLNEVTEELPFDDELFSAILGKYPEYAGALSSLSMGLISYETAMEEVKPLHEKIMDEYTTALKVKHGAV